MRSAPAFALLWNKILDSSLWVTGSKETRLVWITMLAVKDYDGVVKLSVVSLANKAKVSIEECQEALTVLLSPDPWTKDDVEEGRRIREVPGGWQIIKNEAYQFSTEARRQYWRDRQAGHRLNKPAKPLKGERKYVRAVEGGATEAQLNRIVEENLRGNGGDLAP